MSMLCERLMEMYKMLNSNCFRISPVTCATLALNSIWSCDSSRTSSRTNSIDLVAHRHPRSFPPHKQSFSTASMVQPTTARLMQATRARFFRPGMNNQWGYVEFNTTIPQYSARGLSNVLRTLRNDTDILQLCHERKPSSPLPTTSAKA